MDVRGLLSEMALEVQALDDPAQAVTRVAEYTRVAVDADDSGILLVRPRGRIETPAGTSDNVTKAHLLQAELDEGPCLAAIRGGDATYVTGDAAADVRWPHWGRAVAELGYRSAVSVRLETKERVLGSLNAYAMDIDAFAQEDAEVMQFLGAHASAAIAATQKIGDLIAALDSRSTIGHAQGILMAVYDLDADGAFQYMRRLSMDRNTRLLEVAREVISQRQELRKHIT